MPFAMASHRLGRLFHTQQAIENVPRSCEPHLARQKARLLGQSPTQRLGDSQVVVDEITAFRTSTSRAPPATPDPNAADGRDDSAGRRATIFAFLSARTLSQQRPFFSADSTRDSTARSSNWR
jgi:hypothetical protein